jgi:serine/threonine protein kinase
VICPSDDSLRLFLHNPEPETSSTEILSHVATCVECQARISTWDEGSKLESLLKAATNSELAFDKLQCDIPPGESDGDTNAYGSVPRPRVGQYQLVKSIGRGGGGEVFEAKHALLNRRVAIKLLSPQHSGSIVARQRFFREMESIGQLNDPHVVHAYDAGEVDGMLYLAMELVSGENVESLARRLGPLPIEEACEIVRQSALGLQHVYESGLVHRDLKPSNLLMSRTGVKIADLGLALLIRERPADSRLTGHQTVLGTADYMAPEQAEGSHHVDIRADLYSLGCTLYRLLTGQAPYSAAEHSTPIKKMWAHATQPVPDVCALRPEVPAELASLVTRLMAKDRNERLATPQELADALWPYCGCRDISTLGVLPTGVLHESNRSSTFRDRTDPLPSQSKTLYPEPAKRWQPLSLQIGFAVAILVVVAIGLNLVVRPQREQTSGGQSGNSVTPVVKPLQVGPDVAEILPVGAQNTVAIVEKDAAAAPLPVLGPIARRWQEEFGMVPIQLEWPGQNGDGAGRIDEPMKALSVQTDGAIRLMKLGDLPPDGQLTLSLDVISQGKEGTCGFFAGYKTDRVDLPSRSSFHVVQLQFKSSREENRNLLIRRYYGVLDATTTTLKASNNIDRTALISGRRDQVSLKLTLRHDAIDSVLINGMTCDLPAGAWNDPDADDHPFPGAFGVIVTNGSFLFRNPRLERR